MSDTEQAAVATGEPADGSALDEWNAVLAEVEAQPDETPTETTPTETPDESDRFAALERRLADAEAKNQSTESRLESQDLEAEITRTVTAVKGELEVPDDIVRPYVVGKITDDARARRIFMDRGRNPEAWNKLQAALTKGLAGHFGKTEDPPGGDEIESVEALVRNSDSAPPAQKSTFDPKHAKVLIESGQMHEYNKYRAEHS